MSQTREQCAQGHRRLPRVVEDSLGSRAGSALLGWQPSWSRSGQQRAPDGGVPTLSPEGWELGSTC